MKKILTTLSLVAAQVPFALAQIQVNVGQTATQGQVNTSALGSLLRQASQLVGGLVPFAVSLAVLAFFWYLIQFIWKGKEDGDVQKKSMAGMGYSILALFVMVSIWGIVGLLGSMFGIGQGGSVPVPAVPVLQ